MDDDLVRRLSSIADILADLFPEFSKDINSGADRIEKLISDNKELEAALRDTLAAWDFWQSQETRSGFSELFANICEARKALEGGK